MQDEADEEPRGPRCSPGRPEKSGAGLAAGASAKPPARACRAQAPGLRPAGTPTELAPPRCQRLGTPRASWASVRGTARPCACAAGAPGRPRAQSPHARLLTAGHGVRMRGTRAAVSALCTGPAAALLEVSARGRRSSDWAASSTGWRGQQPRARRAPASAPSPRCSPAGLARGSLRGRGRAGPGTCAAGPAGRLTLRCRRLGSQLLGLG